ncbi:c-type cytochrome [Afifella sp. IM 167]|uniref:c-type cytochrome n=1 Tax=Afifella sp. IM 167 TaxID=2033586 RepID=UPI001CCEDCB7|nr:c-type cytochrome [Afifella sp. IM 167]MBZ8135324.1 hypothetical protein [Afifella sp. IM 167]
MTVRTKGAPSDAGWRPALAAALAGGAIGLAALLGPELAGADETPSGEQHQDEGEPALAQEEGHAHDASEAMHDNYIFGRPAEPSETWLISIGGRIYDNWWMALNRDAPEETHPGWPSSNTQKAGDVTWRCSACHGWDYLGADGQHGSDDYRTGVGGVRTAEGRALEEIATILRDERHRYSEAMISDGEALWLARFLSRGQHEADALIDKASGRALGDPQRGKEIFQNICAACHGYDGTALDWGEGTAHAHVGTEANGNPWEVLHKIRNGNPGHEMISLRAFTIEDAVSVLTYAQSLPR